MESCSKDKDVFVTGPLPSLYNEISMRQIIGRPEIRARVYSTKYFCYSDDTVLIAENRKDLQQLLNIVVIESAKTGLSLNINKTETIYI